MGVGDVDKLVVLVGRRDEGVGSDVLVVVVEVEVGSGAPMIALVWMSVLALIVREAWMERMYARGWMRVLASMVMGWLPLT